MRTMLALGITCVFLVAFPLLGCSPSGEQAGKGEKEAVEQKVAAPVVPQASPAPAPEVEADFLMVFADADPEEGTPPLEVKFTADISGGSGQRQVKWDFGDGTKSSEVNPVHVYKKPGTYLATVEVSDSTGDEDDDDVEIIVEEPSEQESPEGGE